MAATAMTTVQFDVISDLAGVQPGSAMAELRALLRKQVRRPGFGATRDDHQRWPNSFFANARLLALHTAWLNARHPR